MNKPAVSTKVPRQQRAIDTYERLLTATGELLGECGFERISTNMIADRAGVTPPTFYRYFEDKYDVMSALGKRLMDVQNELLLEIGEDLQSKPGYVLTSSDLEKLLHGTVKITEAFVGGIWVMKCLRVVPRLNHIRTDSHDDMARAMTEAALAGAPELVEAEIFRQARLSMELGFSAIELVLDDPSLDRVAIFRDTATAIAAFSDAVEMSSVQK
ncbi:MAG: TetR/AcrR family transcriptional regulator [Hyphomonas sp.]|nr:TetR/AcrR family transcriptional regulator [Hyphomonas sp.]